MGLLQKAVETYDAHQELVGIYVEGHRTLAPIGHIDTSAQLEITLDKAGRFQSARTVDKTEPKILIPVTEKSGGRTNNPHAHPLCDFLMYLAPWEEKKKDLYVSQLEEWANSAHSHPILLAVLQYIKGGTILGDLSKSGLIHLDENGIPKEEKKKTLVCWRVAGLEEGNGACWQSPSLFAAFADWYQEEQRGREPALDMITGEYATPAVNHPRSIVSIQGKAKLISSDDDKNYTYRGRFTDESQAATVSYISSQKAHNALRWLVAEQGVYHDGRTFLCWNPQGTKLPSLLDTLQIRSVSPSDYREDLRHTLNGWKSTLPEDQDGVVIAVFDAATSGRLSLTYYNELKGSDFLQHLHDWDAWCCWNYHPYGMPNHPFDYNRPMYIQSPSLLQIVNIAFGTLRNGKFETQKNLLREPMQRMMACRVDHSPIPTDVERALVNRASRLMLYTDKKEADNNKSFLRSKILFTACAVIRKYRHDHKMGECDMALEAEKRDRSYQFGRLLAVMEKVERDTYDLDEKREPNAIRLQSVFCQRPFYAAATIEKQLEKAYFRRLRPGSRMYYKKLIASIMEIINSFPEGEWNRPLEDTYLMGYYLQRNELYKRKKDKTTTGQEEDENERTEQQD